MPEPIATYTAASSGIWSTRHRISGDEGPLGVLSIRRNARGMVIRGDYRPEQGEVLTMRRDPGLLRSQFSLWTDGQEWLGSSLRWHPVRREVHLSTGSKPMRLLPLPGFRRGWALYAPRTGETARITPTGLRSARLDVFRRLDFTILIFSYFLGAQILHESLWPGPAPDRVAAGV